MNFGDAFETMLKNELKRCGFKPNLPKSKLNLGDESGLYHIFYAHNLRRFIRPKPRVIVFATGFSCPPENEVGFNLFCEKVAKGEKLLSHQSKSILNTTKTDMLFNHWEIEHFHLGDGLKGKFVSRSKNVLFAKVTDDSVYCLSIRPHGKKVPFHRQWSDKEYVEIIHRNWPELIEKNRLRVAQLSRTKPLTSEEHGKLFQANCSAPIEMDDGTAYIALGGTALSGDSIYSVLESFKIAQLENFIKKDFFSKENLQEGDPSHDFVIEANGGDIKVHERGKDISHVYTNALINIKLD